MPKFLEQATTTVCEKEARRRLQGGVQIEKEALLVLLAVLMDGVYGVPSGHVPHGRNEPDVEVEALMIFHQEEVHSVVIEQEALLDLLTVAVENLYDIQSCPDALDVEVEVLLDFHQEELRCLHSALKYFDVQSH